MTTQQQYLRDAASLLGLTQKGLAERMGVPWSTFEKWLAPETSKSFREMPQMAWRLIRTESNRFWWRLVCRSASVSLHRLGNLPPVVCLSFCWRYMPYGF